ncbi:MAG: pyridoxal phosphate-dependent aminotransferase [Firmicutes bacterium]|nr:pyridoxal phosphate-dependent aminotransferase [Bacillota bacterium]
MQLSEKAKNISPSLTLSITASANELKQKGVDIVAFTAGEPDYNTPEHIQEAGIKAIKSGITRYTPAAGTLELREAICQKLKNDNGLDYTPEQIIVSSGAKHSLYNVFQVLLNPGDEVIIPVPYWTSYPEFVTLAGGKPVFLETKKEKNFKFSISELEELTTPRTKAIILNSPGNPTGTVFDLEDLKELAAYAVKHGIIVVSDEIYEKLIYDGLKHTSIASLNPEIKELTIVVNGVSKAYAMTGWRIGYAAGRQDIIKAMSNFQSHATSSCCAISQYASCIALTGSQEPVEKMRAEFAKRRDYMAERVNSLPYLSCLKPKGAFYMWVSIEELIGKEIKGRKIDSSTTFADILIKDAHVAVIPGIAFGADDYIRLSYATSIEQIEKGMDRIEKLLATVE